MCALSAELHWVDCVWNVMAHGDAREGRWRGIWRILWVASTLHTISEHGVSSITTADVHNSAASSRLNWQPCRFKWTRPFGRKTKSGFSECAITFQPASRHDRSTSNHCWHHLRFIHRNIWTLLSGGETCQCRSLEPYARKNKKRKER